MTHHYFLIFFGFYGILILLLVLVWQFMRRLRLPRRSTNILYVFAMLLCFVGMGYVRAPWFDIFEKADLINKRGELVTALRTFEIEKPGNKNIKIEAGDLVQASHVVLLRQSGQLKKLVKELRAEESAILRVIKVTEQINLIFKSLPILLVAYLVNSLLSFFLWHGLWLDEEGEPLVPPILRQMSAVLIYLISITIVIAIVAPSLLSGFLTTLGTSGAIAAFLGQEPIKQAFTALSLNINKNIRKGDRVEVMGHSGIVREIGWKSIKLTTIDHNLLTIPNTLLVNNIHTNYSKPDKESLTKILVTVREQAPPDKVKRLLMQAAQDSELVEGTPIVSLLEVKDFRAEYQIEVNTAENNPDRVRNEVLSAVWYMLRREKLHPTAKSNELLLDHPVEKAKELINSVPILQAFTEEEDQLLAETAEWLRYGYPERVVKQGETDAALYIVADGAMSVLVKQENGEKIEVAKLGKNAIFGEMALLTGEPRKATVRAMSEVLLCRISKEAIRPILLNRQAILKEMSEKMAEKQTENEKVLADADAKNQQKEGVANRLLNLMRNFLYEDAPETTKKV